jgi:hypothetical protein
MTGGILMGYPQTSSAIVGNTGQALIPDCRFGNVYGLSADAGATGWRKWDMYPNGKELIARNITTYSPFLNSIYTANTVTNNSQEIVTGSGASNSGELYGFRLTDLAYTGKFGTISSSLANSGLTRMLSASNLCAFTYAPGVDMVVAIPIRGGSFTGGKEVNCVNWNQKLNSRLNLVENTAVIGAIPDGSGTEAWAFGYAVGTAGGRLYKINKQPGIGIALTVIGAVTPAQVDPTWTNITGVAGITVDQTDGNLIMMFSTTDVVAVLCRFVKLNKATGAVMWRAAAGTGINYNDSDMPKNVVKTGKIYYFANTTSTIVTVDTIAGTSSSTSFNAGGPGAFQVSEDVSGSVMWYGSFSDLGQAPAYFGNYCLTLGNHSGANMCWRFWPASSFVQPPFATPAVSRKRAWSFVLDGHTFYVLDLGTQGTFVYDTTTSQWTQFITSGYFAWNFANGCMWGQRIVAGDLLTTDVWEMNPGSLFDNGATTITHVVTGGIVTRNRVYHSVDSFSLACSVGQLQKQDGAATVLLSFSDDQGKTWTDMNTITLTQGDYGGEIAWNSLGSFESPGRIFRITDSGGFLRIDGADAGIDGFDAATADPGS